MAKAQGVSENAGGVRKPPFVPETSNIPYSNPEFNTVPRSDSRFDFPRPSLHDFSGDSVILDQRQSIGLMENYFGQYNFTGETDEDYLNDLIETEQLQNEGIVVLQVEVGDLQDGYSQEQFLSFKDGKTSWGLLKFLLEESDWSDFVNYRPAYDCLVFYPENPGMQLDTCFYDHALGE